ncbi:hypothetical protein DFQ30_004822 [Apophysomyces sp. BC1015]|nr:hypothetical protein DFQ30_004822 [Apophysomyces sp. BC1015]
MIQCPHCETSRSRSRHTAHLLTCPLHPVSCAHNEFGCQWKGQRNELDGHLEACQYEGIKHYLHQQRQQEHSLRDEMKRLHNENNLLRQQQEDVRLQVQSLSNQLSLMFPSHFSNNDLPEDVLQHEPIQLETQQLKDEIDTLSANVASLELKQNVALMTETFRLQEEMQSLRAVCHGMRMQLHYVMMDRRGTMHGAGGSSSNTVNNAPPNPTSTNVSDPPIVRGIRNWLGKFQLCTSLICRSSTYFVVLSVENANSRQDTKL